MADLTSNQIVWLTPMAVPLLVASSLLLRRYRESLLFLAPWAAMPAVVMALAARAGEVDVPWLLLGSRLVLSETLAPLLLMTGILWWMAGMFALDHMPHDAHRARFVFLFLLAMSGNMGVILAGDVATFYFAFAWMSMAASGLVVHKMTSEAASAARVYLVSVLLAEVFLFSALALMAQKAGSIYFDQLARISDWSFTPAALLLVLVGMGVKVGLVPLHMWLPVAHPAAPVAASAVLSGAMLNAGFIGWIHLAPVIGPTSISVLAPLWISLGLMSSIYGILLGCTQKDAKALLAYSSVSQMGMVGVALGLAMLSNLTAAALGAVVLYAVHHGLAKGALFLSVGFRGGRGSEGAFGWVFAVSLVVVTLAMAGFPWTSGALAKAMIKSESAAAGMPWSGVLAIALPLTTIGTTLLMARFLWLMRHGDSPSSAPRGPSMRLAWLVGTGAVLFIVWLWPWSGITVPSGADGKSALGSWPVGVGLLLAIAIAWLGRRGATAWSVTIPPGDLLVPLRRAILRLRPIVVAIAERVEAWSRRWPWQRSDEVGGASLHERLSPAFREVLHFWPYYSATAMILSVALLGMIRAL